MGILYYGGVYSIRGGRVLKVSTVEVDLVSAVGTELRVDIIIEADIGIKVSVAFVVDIAVAVSHVSICGYRYS